MSRLMAARDSSNNHEGLAASGLQVWDDGCWYTQQNQYDPTWTFNRKGTVRWSYDIGGFDDFKRSGVDGRFTVSRTGDVTVVLNDSKRTLKGRVSNDGATLVMDNPNSGSPDGEYSVFKTKK